MGVITASMPELTHTGRHGIAAVDPLRVTVGVQGMGMTGTQVSQLLEKEFAVVAELATQQVGVLTPLWIPLAQTPSICLAPLPLLQSCDLLAIACFSVYASLPSSLFAACDCIPACLWGCLPMAYPASCWLSGCQACVALHCTAPGCARILVTCNCEGVTLHHVGQWQETHENKEE